ncbi:Dephospho-CoA kinase [hydrothermal vent metagenome]|uniref:Dephospho-CoA kinase n=1 Tax=hydrothermal vent metagenome TaxID=652676 RepID=A0A3B0Z5M2_9ZZZZ
MLKIGLTGGIGSGKSTVAEIFEAQGIPVIDTDKISHNLVLSGKPCLEKIIGCFGNHILQADGSLDRAKLRNEVFNNPESKKQLEAIMHPVVINEMQDQAHAVIAPYCILAIPLLIETQLQHSVDRILVVDLPEEFQLKRVQERSKLSLDEIKAIMNTQSSREERRTHAHDIIDNSGDISLLKPQVMKLHNIYIHSVHNGFKAST